MKLLLSEHSGRLGCFLFLSRILLTLSVDTGGINVGSGSANNGPSDKQPPASDPFNEETGLDPGRLNEIRKHKLYPFAERGGGDNNGDYQKDIRDTIPQINKQINFLLPFMGFGFNYTWLSLHGYLTFSNSPQQFPEYPLKFPNQDWPRQEDPSFIAPFYSRCKIGELNGNEVEEFAKKKPGVYFKLERDLYTRTDQPGIEIRERAKWDIREAMVGSDTFRPKHVIIATWKNVSFAGGIPTARRTTNTFQAVIVTDEVRTYAIFNYEWMGWTTHTEAGGDTTRGEGGVPAFVGFNAGNGTRAYEYKPYSQTTQIRDLPYTGGANGFKGRHIFRIDEQVLPGVCIRDLDRVSVGSNLPLVFAPENGNMLGGTRVNLTGPCFQPGQKITCRFNSQDSDGWRVDENRASCIMPTFTEAEGWVDFEVSVDGGGYYWKGMFFVETPATSPRLVWFNDDDAYHSLEPTELEINWDPYNLTFSNDADVKVQISLWGYKENTIEPKLVYIHQLEEVQNNGKVRIDPKEFSSNDDGPEARSCRMGMIMVNLTRSAMANLGLPNSPMIWSKPIPLGWYFNAQWKRYLGSNFVEAMCDKFIQEDREWKNFAYELPTALVDRGRYAPDYECDKDGDSKCLFHHGAQHCVKTGMPNHDGAGQQCCYDLDGYLMMTSDNKWGGKPMRSHNLGVLPWNEAAKIPTLSHWLQDVSPFYPCCVWQSEQSGGCQTYSQDCVGYTPPGGATVFGDPHIYTFDHLEYTFNGLGEYVLVRADSPKVKLDVQGRFEQVNDSPYGTVMATHLTAVAAKDNTSATVEVRVRQPYAQWRYKMDVLVDGRYIYFDRAPQKIQHFKGVTVYTPSLILNQSHVVMMFQSGAGVEVLENKGYMAARVFLPWSFVNQTRGLFGNFSFNMEDDFMTPDGVLCKDCYPNLESGNGEVWKGLHEKFASEWLVQDKEKPELGKSLFFHGNGRSSNFYHQSTWRPEYHLYPEIPQNVTWVSDELVKDLCGDSYQCQYDYATTLSKEFAMFSKYYQDQFVNIYENVLKPESIVISCGQLPTPGNGRKSTFAFVPGTMVKFDCDPGYILVGERRRWCYNSGDWNWPELGSAECVPEAQYNTMQAGITAGIALAVIVPVACVVVCLIQKYREGDESDELEMDRKRRPDGDERMGQWGGERVKDNDYDD